MKKFLELFYKLLDYIYKKRCYFCNSNKECKKMCSKCYDELCHNDVCLNRELLGVKIFSAGVYEKNLQKLIRGLKYHRQKELAFYMAKFMWNYFREIQSEFNLCNDYQVIPVPLHKNRLKKRGYNHMELVANDFCNLSGYTINRNLISRIKNTKPQYKLSRLEKSENLKNAFSVDISKDIRKPVLIIDDICTSGATFSSMIKELKNKGITNIVCLACSSPD